MSQKVRKNDEKIQSDYVFLAKIREKVNFIDYTILVDCWLTAI